MRNCYFCHRPVWYGTDEKVVMRWRVRQIDDAEPFTTVEEWAHYECLETARQWRLIEVPLPAAAKSAGGAL